MTLNRYSCLATIVLSLWDKSHSPIGPGEAGESKPGLPENIAHRCKQIQPMHATLSQPLVRS
jgi:hypothetical protein